MQKLTHDVILGMVNVRAGVIHPLYSCLQKTSGHPLPRADSRWDERHRIEAVARFRKTVSRQTFKADGESSVPIQ